MIARRDQLRRENMEMFKHIKSREKEANENVDGQLGRYGKYQQSRQILTRRFSTDKDELSQDVAADVEKLDQETLKMRLQQTAVQTRLKQKQRELRELVYHREQGQYEMTHNAAKLRATLDALRAKCESEQNEIRDQIDDIRRQMQISQSMNYAEAHGAVAKVVLLACSCVCVSCVNNYSF